MGNSLRRKRSIVTVKTLQIDYNSRKVVWRILLISFLVEAIRLEMDSLSLDLSKIFSVLGDRKLLNGILMSEKESGDSKRVFFIGFSFTQGDGDQQGINNDRIGSFVRQERKEIDMIAACGLHANQDSRKVFTIRGNSLHEFGESAFIHRGRQGKTEIAFRVNACSGERIFRNIDTNKELTHNSTSIKRYLSKAGEASQPILQAALGLKTQSTYYGFGREQTPLRVL